MRVLIVVRRNRNMVKSETVQLLKEIHPNLFEIKIIYPMLNALGKCVSGEYINAVEDWWLSKVKNDITWQRFQVIPETQAIRYENQYMVEKYFEYIKMQLPALTGTVFEHLDLWQNPPLTLSDWLGKLGLSRTKQQDNTSWWRNLRTDEEQEMNRHPNRSSRWIPNRLRTIKSKNTFYFGKPLTRPIEKWSEREGDYTEEKIITDYAFIPEDHEKWKQYEYISPFTYKETAKGSRTPIWLKNPNTMEYFEKGEDKIDYNATASVYLQTTSLGEWQVVVVKFFDITDEKVSEAFNEYDFGQRYAAILTFGTEDLHERHTGNSEGVRLYPKSFTIRPTKRDDYVAFQPAQSKITWRDLRVMNYYAPEMNQHGMLNWYGSF